MNARLALHLVACAAAAWLTACAAPTWTWPAANADEAEAEPTLVFQPPSDLPAPQGLDATSGLYRRVVLQWDPVLEAGVGGYLVESAEAAEGPFVERAVLRDRGTLAWIDGDGDGDDTGLDDEQTRYYRLRSFDRANRVSSVASEVVAASTAPLPAPPDGLRAFSQQPRSVPLVWRASDDARVAGYAVERSPSADGPFEVVAEVDDRHAPHVLDTGLGDLRVLHYRVASKNAGGVTGAPSAAVRAVTKPAPLPPVGLAVRSRRLGAATLVWQPNVEGDLESYRLLRRREGEDEAETVGYVAATRTEIDDANLGAGELVSYELVAVDRDGLESGSSVPVEAQGIAYEWSATASAGGVRLRWNPRADEGYVGARVTRSSRPWDRVVFEAEAAELLDAEVVAGRRYTYVIELTRADGSFATPSQPIEIEVPEAGEGFVEIPPPTSRLPRPGDVPR